MALTITPTAQPIGTEPEAEAEAEATVFREDSLSQQKRDQSLLKIKT